MPIARYSVACRSSIVRRFSSVCTGTLVRRAAIQLTALDAAAEQQHATGIGKVPVHAVVLELGHHVGNLNLVFNRVVGLAFQHHVAAEFAGHDDQRAIQQSAFLEIEHQLRDRSVDLGLELGESRMAVVVGVPIEEWNVLGGHLDESRARLGQSPSEQATLAEASGVVLLKRLARFER